MGAKYNNNYTQEVYNILAPLLGDLMTQNVLKIQVRKIGRTLEDISRSDLPQLAEGIRGGLVIFLGSEAAKNISSKIQSIH
jgi:hypothetical protein